MANATEPVWEGPKRYYTDPFRRQLPELERCLIRHRALQMILVMYHAEELKRDVVECVEAQRHFKVMMSDDGKAPEESTGSKRVKRAFDHLVKDGVISTDERREMVKLIERRNSIVHHLDEVTADLSTDRWVREMVDIMRDRQQHDYEALDRLKEMRRLLAVRAMEKHYVGVISMRGLSFEATERVLRTDIKGLERRIRKLVRKRREDIKLLNSELSLRDTELVGVFDPRWPENRYDERARLTPRGIEICYRLFDLGKSAVAVAHLMGLSLASARRREKQWWTLGGAERQARALAEIPKVRLSYRRDD
jgi:hypothetical protein